MSLNLIGLLGVAFTFGVAIFVHEFGHFIVAKLLKVPVATFCFGFGKKIVKHKWKGTTYAIGIIPFGGYVQLGEEKTEPSPEDNVENSETDEEGKEKKKTTDGIMEDIESLRGIPYLAKVGIFSAGVFFNLLTALFVLTLIYTIGFKRDAPWEAKINEITDPVVAGTTELREGDRILAVESYSVSDWFDFQALFEDFSQIKPNEPLFLIIKRNNEKFGINVPLFLDDNPSSPIISYLRPPIPAYIGRVLPNLRAERSGLENGDMIVAINDEPVESWFEMAEIIRRNPGNPLIFKVLRNGETHRIEVTPRPNPRNPSMGEIGIIMGNPKKITEQKPFPESLFYSVELSYFMTRFLIKATYDLFKSANFALVRENIGGPVAIAILSYQAARSGWSDFFNFFAILNLLLFIFNILPIPVLDGGHILIATIEKVTGRHIPPKVLVRIFSVMLVLLIALAIWVTLNDIVMNIWRLGFGK